MSAGTVVVHQFARSEIRKPVLIAHRGADRVTPVTRDPAIGPAVTGAVAIGAIVAVAEFATTADNNPTPVPQRSR